MAKGTGGAHVIARNRKARHEYAIEDTYEAGMVLLGSEVKSLRAGKASLNEGFAVIEGGEAWLLDVHIAPYEQAHQGGHEPRRRRKLLLNARELHKLTVKLRDQGYTLVPLDIHFRRGVAKVELGVGRGKRKYDKRESQKQREHNRDVQRALHGD